jgi:hypothetical protein
VGSQQALRSTASRSSHTPGCVTVALLAATTTVLMGLLPMPTSDPARRQMVGPLHQHARTMCVRLKTPRLHHPVWQGSVISRLYTSIASILVSTSTTGLAPPRLSYVSKQC